jgi:hypothetical protein
MNIRMGMSTIPQLLATNLAETLTMLEARLILFLKQHIITMIKIARRKQTTATIILAVGLLKSETELVSATEGFWVRM